jgi:hypothetical protein
VGYLAWHLLNRWNRIVCIVGLVVLVATIGLTRLYLEVPTDALARYLAALSG